MNRYPIGFEEDEQHRSAFIRELTILQLAGHPSNTNAERQSQIPRRLIRYWHDPHDLPDDVRACLNSWDRLVDEGFELLMYDDTSAARYIADRYGSRESEAFSRCRHPAMRCDYLRMCAILADGGFYVDADDVLLGDEWRHIFRNDNLKIQPLCYDISSHSMLPAREIWRADLPTTNRIFYVNNDPIAAAAGHPVLSRALIRATEKLLGNVNRPEIQSTTGPGNLTAALAAHANDLLQAEKALDFELLWDWEAIAETRWELSYRNDSRNWRNMGSD